MEKCMTKFFAAANTEDGFFSLFDEIFPPEKLKRIYILKGGPGTGKSTLMRSVGFTAEANGYDAEYYYCSSDTGSLDGVVIPALGIAVMDGTAPHMTDPRYPGAVERIVNLGEAFDLAGLEGERERLLSQISAKRDAYRTAYRYLSAAGHRTGSACVFDGKGGRCRRAACPFFKVHAEGRDYIPLYFSDRHKRTCDAGYSAGACSENLCDYG